ncbi:MAG: hypothetical protein ABI199_00455 [Bacteroidia bacterium]
MKKILRNFLLLLFVISFAPQQKVTAQNNVQVTWGPELKSDSRREAMLGTDIIGENATSFYTLTTQPATLFSDGHIFFEEFSKSDMTLVRKQEILMPKTDGKREEFGTLLYVKGKMILFTSYYNSDQKKNYDFVQSVNNDGTVNPDAKKIDEIEVTKSGLFGTNKGSFSTILSTDSSKILVYRSETYKKNETHQFHCKVLDLNLNEIWSKELELPYKDKNFSVSDYTLDNNGDVYMLAKIELEKDQHQKGDPNYKYEILYYNHTADALKEYDLSIGQKYITSVAFKLNTTGDLVCAGFYSNKNSYSVAGSFYLKIDEKTKNVVNTGFKEFDKDILAKFMSVRKVNKGNEINDMKVDEILFHDDGTAYMISEQYWVAMITTYDPQTHSSQTTTIYHANNIVVVNFAADGSIVWAKCIVKTQESENDFGMYLSYSVQEVGKKLFFMFNDNVKNLKIPNSDDYKTMSNPRKSVAMLVTMDEKGDEQRNSMFNAKDLEVILRPILSLQVSPSAMIIYGDKRKNFKYGRVTFQ